MASIPGEGEVSVHAIESGCKTPLIFTWHCMKVNDQPHSVAALAPMSIELGAVWAPEAVQTYWKREGSFAPAEIRTLVVPIAQLLY